MWGVENGVIYSVELLSRDDMFEVTEGEEHGASNTVV